MKMRQATKDDLQQVRLILENSNLILQGIEDIIDDFIVLHDEDSLHGCVGLEVYGDVALLRSLAVKLAFQKKGYGLQLLKEIEMHAKSRNVNTLFLLTNTAESFFAKYGYLVESRERAPKSIIETEEFSELCPESSIFMKKDLEKE